AGGWPGVRRRMRVRRAAGGVVEEARTAAALPLVGRVVGERDVAALRHPPGVQARRLLLDAAAGVHGHDRRVPLTLVEPRREVQVPDHLDAAVAEGDSFHASSLRAGGRTVNASGSPELDLESGPWPSTRSPRSWRSPTRGASSRASSARVVHGRSGSRRTPRSSSTPWCAARAGSSPTTSRPCTWRPVTPWCSTAYGPWR